MSLLHSLTTTILGLFKNKNKEAENRMIKTLVVPCTNVLPFAIYEAYVDKKRLFEENVYIGESAYRSCNFVVPKEFKLKSGELMHGAKLTGYLSNDREDMRTIVVQRLQKVGNHTYLVMSQAADAYLVKI